jgi:hypothetical protein
MVDEKIKTLNELVKGLKNFYEDQMEPAPGVLCYDGRRAFKLSNEIEWALNRLEESRLWMESYIEKMAPKTTLDSQENNFET